MGKYLDLAKEFTHSPDSPSIPIPRAESESECSRSQRLDPYAWRVKNAFEAICRPDYPEGMLDFLEHANPHRYADLVQRLPLELEQLWRDRASIERFERVLDRWVGVHRAACGLYLWHLSRRQSTEKSPQAEIPD